MNKATTTATTTTTTTIVSDYGLTPIQRQIIIWTTAGLSLIVPLGVSLSEILVKQHNNFHSRKWLWKCMQKKCQPFVSAWMC